MQLNCLESQNNFAIKIMITQTSKDQLKSMLTKYDLSDIYQQLINDSGVKSYFLQWKANNHGRISKIGGRPNLPKKYKWPTNLSFPMSFLMQIDLHEISHLSKFKNLPKNGIIYIFTDERQDLESAFDCYDEQSQRELFEDLKPYSKFQRYGKGENFKIIYAKEEDCQGALSEYKTPKELKQFAFTGGPSGFILQDLVRDEYFLTVNEILFLDFKKIEIGRGFDLATAMIRAKNFSHLKSEWKNNYEIASNLELFPQISDKEVCLLRFDNSISGNFYTHFEQFSVNPNLDAELIDIGNLTEFSAQGDFDAVKLEAEFEIYD